MVEEAVAEILADGTGADRQRAIMVRTRNLRDVVFDAAERTIGSTRRNRNGDAEA
ncbi:hypothetical protein QFZ40_004222 [Arthrobacter pascens]|uniref:hypothetical protein n=1 Tax=Arthrobacter pascens TaxID=1677 RepID=UPI00278AEAE6|nr:hypothetical protein [Arthrobacter pascens]MDQ0636313.1 hypothetical protein [Arthrobacter pascens]